VTVDGDGFISKGLSLTVDQLENDFPQAKVTCTLQCAGNRRHTMRTRIKEVLGVDWMDAALMTLVAPFPFRFFQLARLCFTAQNAAWREPLSRQFNRGTVLT
jgi:DMSO/TMAO reductase YedYZ molybdopterin-dependent catalytic subunit